MANSAISSHIILLYFIILYTIFQIGQNLPRNFAKLSSSKVQYQLELSLAQFSPSLFHHFSYFNLIQPSQQFLAQAVAVPVGRSSGGWLAQPTIVDRYFHFSFLFHFHFCQAQFQLASSVQVQLRTQISHCETPPHPGKYIWAPCRLPRELKFGMEALFNQTRSTS